MTKEYAPIEWIRASEQLTFKTRNLAKQYARALEKLEYYYAYGIDQIFLIENTKDLGYRS